MHYPGGSDLECNLVTAHSAELQAAEPVKVLMPRGSGHQFVCYGDCCSGVPGNASEANFAAVNAVVGSLSPKPEFICFVGDHVEGLTTDYDELRRQWRYWLDHEMAWLDKSIPVYHVTSNHNTYDEGSEAVWRDIFPDIPKNGPPGQEGLAYWIRKGDLLLVIADTQFSGLGGRGHVEHWWLDRVLAENEDALFKFVFGHYPVFPVNGYDRHNWWIVQPSDGKDFWSVLVRHEVLAYICSHIIAYDVQVHEGVLQITTGGAGTEYGPGGFMPGQTEYFHAVQMAVDQLGLRCQVLDARGVSREWLNWPLAVPPVDLWELFTPDAAKPLSGRNCDKSDYDVLCWRFVGNVAQDAALESQTVLSGWAGLETLWIGIEGAAPRLTVRLVPEPGGGAEVWTGPVIQRGQPFDIQMAFHSGMGPGGILWRMGEGGKWTSMSSTSARGTATMAWPHSWTVGHCVNGPSDRPFAGRDLQVTWIRHRAMRGSNEG